MEDKQLVSTLRPRTVDGFVGNTAILGEIQKQLLNNSFTHLAIFTGTNGVGKSTLAEYIGMSLTCSDRADTKPQQVEQIGKIVVTSKKVADPCGKCPACQAALSSGFTSGAVKKFDMTHTLTKKDNIEVVKEIFTLEGSYEKNVFILEEFQSLSKDRQAVFLEYFTKVPDDVYVFICTDSIATIIPAIRNRFAQIALGNPTIQEAVDFTMRSASRIGLRVESKQVAKNFVMANDSNPRQIVTGLEWFRNVGEMTATGVNAFYDLHGDMIDQLWAQLFDPDVPEYDFFKLVSSTVGEENEAGAKRIFNELHLKSLTNHMEGKSPINSSTLSTVEKGNINKILNKVGNNYIKVLAQFRSPVTNAADVVNILQCMKVTIQNACKSVNASVGAAKSQSLSGSKQSSLLDQIKNR